MWGYHLRIDAAGCNDAILNAGKIETFCADLVAAINMKAYGEPQIVRFGDDPKVTGYTLIQLIETSNISAHFCDNTHEAYIDVFSCVEFDVEAALECVATHFAPENMQHDHKARQA